jgi:hypothetical protein
MNHTIAVFGASRSTQGDRHYEEGIVCGRLLAENGFAVATGGYGGTMEAVSLGARGAGGHVVGVTAPSVFPGRSGPNDHLTHETEATSLVDRIGVLAADTSGAIALWGSLGTTAELLVAWNLAYVARFTNQQPKPIIGVGEPWVELIPHLESSLETDTGLVAVVESVPEAIALLMQRLQ